MLILNTHKYAKFINFEINFFFFFILKYFPNFFKNTFFSYKFFFNFYKILNLKKKSLNIYHNIKSNYIFEKFKPKLISNNCLINKKKSNLIKNNFSYKFFNLIFIFNYSMFNTLFKFNSNFKMFYLYETNKQLIILDSKKFINRWIDAYDLIFNIFFYNYNPLIFSTKFFKNQTLSINWNYNFFDINLWNYFYPFFIFKLNKYNHKSNFFFEKLNYLNINFFLITDCTYHIKNIHYMKKNNAYTVGLINANINPWTVSYPIISFFDSFLTQSFFFKFLIIINKLVLYNKFIFFKNIWYMKKLYK